MDREQDSLKRGDGEGCVSGSSASMQASKQQAEQVGAICISVFSFPSRLPRLVDSHPLYSPGRMTGLPPPYFLRQRLSAAIPTTPGPSLEPTRQGPLTLPGPLGGRPLQSPVPQQSS